MKSIKLEIIKKLKHYGEKVKQISFHQSKPLLLMAHYNGEVSIFNYNTQTLLKKIEASKKPIRTAIWAGEDWIVTGGDDLKIRIFNFHTTQKLYEFEGHKDFLRKVIFNPNFQYILSCSDDKSIIKWSLSGEKFINSFIYEEHKHFVMDIKLQSNTEDIFGSASLDGTIKIWNINSKISNYTLKGHKAGINCLEFSKGNRSHLASGGDDFVVIIWDLSTRTILQKIEKHEGNVVDLVFMTSLPFLVSISEDGNCNFYNTRNFEFCFDQNNHMDKGWSVAVKENLVACGHDGGASVIQVGKNQTLASCGKGKLIWSKNNEIFSSNLKAIISKTLRNFEKIETENKEMGSLEIFPHKILHNDSAQFFALVDESEYLVYKAQTYKQVLYGKCKDFVWGTQNRFAILDQHNDLVIQNVNGNILSSIKFDFYVDTIFGGTYLGAASSEFILFYDWSGENNIGRIDVQASNLYWDNNFLTVKSEKTFFGLLVNPELEDENVFQLVYEVSDSFVGCLYISGLFFYLSETFKLHVILSGKSFVIANIGFQAMMLEYLDNHERLFLFDTNCQISSFKLSQTFLKILVSLKTITSSVDDSIVEKGLTLSEDENNVLVKILQAFQFFDVAFKVSKNISQKIDLGIKQKKIDETMELCESIKEPIYWKKLGDLALTEGHFDIAEKCFWSCDDFNSLFLIGLSLANSELLIKIGQNAMAVKNYSLAYNAFWNVNQADKCLSVLIESEKFGEALIFARTYLPSEVSKVYTSWLDFASYSANHVLAKRINRFLSNEERNIDSIEVEKILKNENIKVKQDNSARFNEEYLKTDVNELYRTQGAEKLSQFLNDLHAKVETKIVNKEDTIEEAWNEAEIPDDFV